MSTAATSLLPEIQKRLHKTIDARTHGIIDYCHAAAFLTLGFILLKSNKRAAAAALTTGSFVLVQSLLTDYPLGVKPLIPFHVHGQMDGAFASSSWALPFVFGFANTAPAKIFTTNSWVEGVVVALTDFSTEHARAQKAVATLLS